MDDESVDDVRDELRSGWGGESRREWWGWRKIRKLITHVHTFTRQMLDWDSAYSYETLNAKCDGLITFLCPAVLMCCLEGRLH